MKASFFEYHVAMSGLFTARANLNVVSHNVANAAMPGFSRQYTVQSANRPLALYDGKGMYGTGSSVTGIKQMRDTYLDRKYWQHRGVQGEYITKNAHLSLIETIFNDLPDAGVLSCFQNFFNTLQDLSTTANDATYRSGFITAADTLAEMIRTNAQALQKQQRDVNREVSDTVVLVNSLGTQIATLNDQIARYERDGSHANDLRDQRALLVDQLSEFVNVEVDERDYSTKNIPYDTRYFVSINGYEFVSQDRVNTLMVVPREIEPPYPADPKDKLAYDYEKMYDPTSPDYDAEQARLAKLSGEKRNEMDVVGLYDIYFTNAGFKFDIYSPTLQGSLKGLIDIRDGNNGYKTEGLGKDAKAGVVGAGGTYTNETAGIGNAAIENYVKTLGDIDLTTLSARIGALTSSSSTTAIQTEATNLFKMLSDANMALDNIEEIMEVHLVEYPAGGFDDADPKSIVDGLTAFLGADNATANAIAGSINALFTNPPPLNAATVLRTALTAVISFINDANTQATAAINALTGTLPGAPGDKSNPVPPDTAIKLPTAYEEPYNSDTTVYKGIPFYMNKLNTLVRTFARAVNEGQDAQGNRLKDPAVTGHVDGYSYPSQESYGNNVTDLERLSLLLFTYANGKGGLADLRADDPDKSDYSLINCINFSINPQLTEDPYKLACATESKRNSGVSQNDLTLAFATLHNNPSLFKEGKLLDFIVGTTTHLAVDRRQAINFEESYEEIVMQTDNQRMSVSGVSINEEMADMIKYNQMYLACAKLVNVINQIYDTMINRLGVS